MQRKSRFAWQVVRRLLDVLVVAVLVVVAASVLIHLAPGDPARSILGTRATPDAVEALSAQLNLDEPVVSQIGSNLAGAAQGDLGTSIITGTPVNTLVMDALGVTVSIIAMTVLLSLTIGVPAGIWSALSYGRLPDRVLGMGGLIVLAIPPFVIALLLLGVVAVGLGLLPAGGWSDDWPGAVKYGVLPSIALAGYLGPQVMRSTRQSAMGIINLQFLEAAEARGLSRVSIVLRHLLPNSALPIITVIGVNAGALISGAVVVEALFGIPGLGQLIQTAVASRDYPVLAGAALMAAIGVVVVNFCCELLYRLLDPRVRVAT